MAKQIGSEKFKGTIDGFSFYHNRMHGYLVRHTGGVTSKQYHTDNRYAAARDASREFASVSKAGKLIRTALAEFIAPVKDPSMVNRLNKELIALKQSDNINSRGKRKPETRIADPDANSWFRIFQFNENVKLYNLCTHAMPRVPNAPVSKRRDAIYRVQSINPEAFPPGATHARLTLIKTIIDFENGTFQTTSRDAIHRVQQLARVSDSCPEPKTGIEITCLQVLFFHRENGKLVQLKEKVHAMGIIGIRKIEANATSVAKVKLKRNKKTRFFRPNIKSVNQLEYPSWYKPHTSGRREPLKYSWRQPLARAPVP